MPKDGNVYVGAPGAVIDGDRTARYAFTGRARSVTVKHLTIQNFGAPGANMNEGVVNHDAGSDWTVEFNTIQGNAGAGLFLGSGNVVRYNCLLNNEQYGFSMYVPPVAGGANAITNITLDHNEIAGNNTYDWESRIAGCGCTGGGKFWDVDGARVTNNWVHHNKSVGLWADTNDVDFLVEGNYIEENDHVGFFYEISYNAVVRNNTFKRNAIKAGLASQARGDNFPLGAIYLSEAGGNARASSTRTGTTNLEIIGNTFENNWDGVVLWENPDRFFNSLANTSGTAYVPKGGVASTTTCNDPAAGGSIHVEPAYSDCRWRTKDVKVSGNTFAFDPGAVSCTTGRCGRNALFSQYGTYPTWSPYMAWTIADAITFSQGNVWSGNAYTGQWRFLVHDTGTTVSQSTWQAAPYSQDAGSTFNGAGSQPAPSTTIPGGVAEQNHLSADTAGFERSVGSWVPWFSTSLARSGYRTSGRAGGRIDINAPYGWGLQLSNWPGFPATSGPKAIGFSGRLGAGNVGATMTVRWRDDGGTDLRTDRVSLRRLSTAWQRATAAVTAPAGTTRVWVELTGSGGPGDFLYVDDFLVG